MPVTLTGAAKASHERKVLTDAARREMCSRRPGSAHATATLLVAAVTAGMQHTCGNSRNDPGDCPACEWEDDR